MKVDSLREAAWHLASGQSVEIVYRRRLYFLISGKTLREPTPAEVERAVLTLQSPLLRAA